MNLTEMDEYRIKRAQKLIDSAPIDVVFVGYGGSGVREETLVFNMIGGIQHQPIWEIRIPMFPEEWDGPEEIESEYGCFAVYEWEELEDRLDEVLD